METSTFAVGSTFVCPCWKRSVGFFFRQDTSLDIEWERGIQRLFLHVRPADRRTSPAVITAAEKLECKVAKRSCNSISCERFKEKRTMFSKLSAGRRFGQRSKANRDAPNRHCYLSTTNAGKLRSPRLDDGRGCWLAHRTAPKGLQQPL